MVEFVNIRKIRHVFVDQVRNLINEQLSLVFDYQVNYFVGKSSSIGENVLCFEITSPQLGSVYRKAITLKEEHAADVPEELHDQFIGMIVGDFTVVSIGLITKDIVSKGKISTKDMKRGASKMVANPEKDKPFSKGGFRIFNPN